MRLVKTRKITTPQNFLLVLCIDSMTMAFISPLGRGSSIRCSRGSSGSLADASGKAIDSAIVAMV